MKCEKFVRKEGPLKFTWDFCGLCNRMMVRCPNCNNNCCNSSYGTLEDGTKCNICNLAYEYQDLAFLTKTVPEFSEEEKDRLRNEYIDSRSDAAELREREKLWKEQGLPIL